MASKVPARHSSVVSVKCRIGKWRPALKELVSCWCVCMLGWRDVGKVKQCCRRDVRDGVVLTSRMALCGIFNWLIGGSPGVRLVKLLAECRADNELVQSNAAGKL